MLQSDGLSVSEPLLRDLAPGAATRAGRIPGSTRHPRVPARWPALSRA